VSCTIEFFSAWQTQPIAISCPSCGIHPIEDEQFEKIFPTHKHDQGTRIAIIYKKICCLCSDYPEARYIIRVSSPRFKLLKKSSEESAV